LPKVDLVLTDPPYPDWLAVEFRADEFEPGMLDEMKCHQFVFWSAKVDFPLDWTAVHIWHKTGSEFASYERIFERNGKAAYSVFTGNPISNPVMARFAKDFYSGHPTQKPVSLMQDIIQRSTAKTILDPFMGSGTTLVAAKMLNRKAIGIELEEKYCEIAALRLAQDNLFQDP